MLCPEGRRASGWLRNVKLDRPSLLTASILYFVRIGYSLNSTARLRAYDYNWIVLWDESNKDVIARPTTNALASFAPFWSDTRFRQSRDIDASRRPATPSLPSDHNHLNFTCILGVQMFTTRVTIECADGTSIPATPPSSRMTFDRLADWLRGLREQYGPSTKVMLKWEEVGLASIQPGAVEGQVGRLSAA